jgi:transcriptional regulator with XRE-family HTH domain
MGKVMTEEKETTKQKAERLKAQGLTQKAIAIECGVTEARISQLIGKRRIKIEVEVHEQTR